ncbi:MAG: NADH-quinone oxidoreductase subunit C [Alphaproteobacteria bacterium]|nr:NADH-quinone oxidoreductase subunit C [Alphaproteobacteria bacterium]
MLSLERLQSEVTRALGSDVMHLSADRGELSVLVPRPRVADVLRTLRDDPVLAMSQLVDICGVDYPERPERFEIVYNLLSLRANARVRIKIHADEIAPVPTATGVYSGAGWYEREVWDMFGVTFAGNADLRRILTDYGFEGHPLRKDFPLTGYTEVRYDPDQKRIVYEPVKLPQDFRSFDFLSPWEGMTDVNMRLPGDEKAEEKK